MSERTTTPLIPLLLTKKQVAQLLSVSSSTVGRLVAAGLLREKLAGGNKRGRKRYLRRDVERLAEKGWTWGS